MIVSPTHSSSRAFTVAQPFEITPEQVCHSTSVTSILETGKLRTGEIDYIHISPSNSNGHTGTPP